jgi:hypothetical protein
VPLPTGNLSRAGWLDDLVIRITMPIASRTIAPATILVLNFARATNLRFIRISDLVEA